VFNIFKLNTIRKGGIDMFAMKSMLKLFFIVIFSITILFVSNGLSQEIYPNRPITVVVAWPAGMMLDTMTRLLCKAAEKELGQPIVVENRPGASGVIGASYVFKSAPDGYTLLMVSTPDYFKPHTVKIPYDPFKDTVDICGVFKYTNGLIVRNDAPWKTMDDLIAYAKKNPPGKFKYATTGVGTSHHVVMEYIAMEEGIKWTMIPFASNPAVAFLGGHVDGLSAGIADLLPLIQAGKARLLLALNDFRWSDCPDVPHMLERGYSFYTLNFIALAGPKGISEPIKKKLEKVFLEATKDPSFVEAANKYIINVTPMRGEEYTKDWQSRYTKVGEVSKAIGIKQ
jgi:tripartite-type tricarboxylate transporter receptor subunit TctC